MGIEDSYEAYCFDEVALKLEVEATDDKGKCDWSRLKWTDVKPKDNQDLMKFIEVKG